MLKKIPYIFAIYIITVSASYCSERTDDIKFLIERLFRQTDSLFISVAKEPEIRMKEVAPAGLLFKKTVKKHSFFYALIRTNSRGLIVNEVVSHSNPGQRYRDISQEEWYEIPVKTSKPYYGPITIVNNKIVFIWSKPLFIQRRNGKFRSGGVVAAQIDIKDLLDALAKKFQGSARCLYRDSVFYKFSWSKPSNYKEYPIFINGKKAFYVQCAIAYKTAEDKVDSTLSKRIVSDIPSDPVRSAPPSKPFDSTESLVSAIDKRDTIEKTLLTEDKKFFTLEEKVLKELALFSNNKRTVGIIITLIFALILIAVIVILKLRFRKGNEVKKGEAQSANTTDGSIMLIDEEEREQIEKQEEDKIRNQVRDEYSENIKKEALEELRQEIKEKVQKTEVEKIEKETIEKLRENIATRVKLEHVQELEKTALYKLEFELKKRIQETETENLTREANDQLRNEIRKELEDSESELIRAEIRKALYTEIINEIRKNEYDNIYAQVRKELEAEVREKLIKSDSDLIRDQERRKLSAQIRQELVEEEQENIQKHEREVIRQDAVAIVRNNEFANILNQERKRIIDDIQKRIKDEEYASIESEEHDKLTEEVRKKLRSEELETITKTMREEMTELIQKELEENERDKIYNTIKGKIEEKIQNRIINYEIDIIRNKIHSEIMKEERKRIEENERAAIIENEKKRIAREEYETLCAKALKHIHDEEMPDIMKRIKKEIYSETVDDIKTNLTEKIKASMIETMNQEKETYNKIIQDEYRKDLQEEYHYLIGIVRNMDNSLKNIEALDSLQHTITRLMEEKNKYKFFNLNAAQTESLLEYLQRLLGNLDTYFDSLDNTLNAIKIKVNNILNRLGEDNTLL